MVYIVPSTTIGVTWCRSSDRDWNTHLSSRSRTFPGCIEVSKLCRWLIREPEYVSQFCGSRFDCRIRSNVTLGGGTSRFGGGAPKCGGSCAYNVAERTRVNQTRSVIDSYLLSVGCGRS